MRECPTTATAIVSCLDWVIRWASDPGSYRPSTTSALADVPKQSPIHPNYKQRLHLPLSQQEFYLGRADGRVEVRSNFYNDEEFAKSQADTYFDIRPQYRDE